MEIRRHPGNFAGTLGLTRVRVQWERDRMEVSSCFLPLRPWPTGLRFLG